MFACSPVRLFACSCPIVGGKVVQSPVLCTPLYHGLLLFRCSVIDVYNDAGEFPFPFVC